MINITQNNTVGSAIRDLRQSILNPEGKPWSQLELSLAIGWENPSTLCRIESGQVIPTRETIIKIARALKLDLEDMNILLRMGNYHEYEPYVDNNYIEELVSKFDKEFNESNYPILLLDENSYLIFWNEYADKIFLNPMGEINSVVTEKFINRTQCLTHLDILFDLDLGFRQRIVNWEEFTTKMLTNTYFNFLNYPLQVSLPILIKELHRYPDFSRLWEKVSSNSNPHTYKYNIPFVYNHPSIGIINLLITTYMLAEDKRVYVEQFLPESVEDQMRMDDYIQDTK